MKPKKWSELVQTLREVHAVASNYRFGQLVCNVATFVGKSEIVFAWEADDGDLLVGASGFLEAHRRTGREDRGLDERWAELLEKLERLGEEYPGVRFGEMVRYLAIAVRGPESGDGAGAMWEVEEDELIAVADRWLAYRTAQHEAEAALRSMG